MTSIKPLPFSDKEANRGEEGDDADKGGEVAGAGVLVHDANLLPSGLEEEPS